MAAKQMTLKMACVDGIQECLETVRDLRANNSEDEYLKGLDDKIHAVEKHASFFRINYSGICGRCTDDPEVWYCNNCFVGGYASGKR